MTKKHNSAEQPYNFGVAVTLERYLLGKHHTANFKDTHCSVPQTSNECAAEPQLFVEKTVHKETTTK